MVGPLGLEVKRVVTDPECSRNGGGSGEPPGQANLPSQTSALRVREVDGHLPGLPVALAMGREPHSVWSCQAVRTPTAVQPPSPAQNLPTTAPVLTVP